MSCAKRNKALLAADAEPVEPRASSSTAARPRHFSAASNLEETVFLKEEMSMEFPGSLNGW